MLVTAQRNYIVEQILYASKTKTKTKKNNSHRTLYKSQAGHSSSLLIKSHVNCSVAFTVLSQQSRGTEPQITENHFGTEAVCGQNLEGNLQK